jgi:hypothetical protein
LSIVALIKEVSALLALFSSQERELDYKHGVGGRRLDLVARNLGFETGVLTVASPFSAESKALRSFSVTNLRM